VDAEPEVHGASLDLEQRRVGARHRAAVEGHAEREGRGVGRPHHPLDLVEVEPGLGGSAGDLVDGEGAGDAAALADLRSGGGGDVVGDVDDPRVDALGPQPVGRHAEVEHVTRVVAEAQHHAGAAVRGAPDTIDLLRGRGGEQVAEDARVGEAGPDDAVVGGEVPRPTTDQQADLALRRTAGADEARGVRHPLDVGGVGQREAADDLVLELRRVVVHVRHGASRRLG
jgi:hypothetical protein